MKHFFFAISFCLSFAANAGQISFTCIGQESDDCPVTVEVTLDNEMLLVNGRDVAAAPVEVRHTFFWCSERGLPGQPAYVSKGWKTGLANCNEKGTFRVLNGELTKRQLADADMLFEIRKNVAYCYSPSRQPTCLVLNP